MGKKKTSSSSAEQQGLLRRPGSGRSNGQRYTLSAGHEAAEHSWPATYEEGVDMYLASPAFVAHTPSYAEKSRLQQQADAIEAGGHGATVVVGTSSFKDAVVNSINVLLGVGVLASPFALRSAGLVAGVPLFFLFTFITNHTAKLLGRCLDYQAGMMTYPDIGEAAFGTRGRVFISVVFFLELFCACAMFDVLIGDTLAALIPTYSEAQLTVMAFLVIMPTTWTTHLSLLSYFSAIGILSSLFCLYSVFYIGLAIDTSAPDYTIGSLLHPQPLQVIGDSDRMPLSIGLTMVAFGGHSVFPTICSSLTNRKEFPKVVNYAYVIVALVYGAIELAGYLMFGTHTKKEITLNLIDVFPGLLTRMVIWTIALNPMSKIAITIHPVALAIEEIVFTREEMNSESRAIAFYRAFIRTSIGVAALFCALFIPHFARMTSFLGACFAMIVSVLMPCVCYMKLFWNQISRFEIALNGFLAVLSLFFMVIGTAASFMSPAD